MPYLSCLSDGNFDMEDMQKTNVTLRKHALQALPGLSTLGAAGGSCCGVCSGGVVCTRGVGTSEVVCRHGGDV
jgi:hypothetical protein